MRRDITVDNYLRELNRSLPGSARQRKRVTEEVEGHLRDAISAYESQGVPAADAAARALDEFGPPHEFASGFDDGARPTPPARGIGRWLPLLLPGVVVLARLGLLVRNIAWLPGGLTRGQRLVLQNNLLSLLIATGLLLCTYVAVRRADRERSWRLVPWGLSVAVLIATLVRAV